MDPCTSAEILVQASLSVFEKAGEISLKLKGNCMWPVLRDGDIVTVQKFPFEKLRPGDAALFQTSANTFHANVLFARWDPSVTPQHNYLGKITQIDRCGKLISMDDRSGFSKGVQMLAAPANPYFLGLPLYLKKRFFKSA